MSVLLLLQYEWDQFSIAKKKKKPTEKTSFKQMRVSRGITDCGIKTKNRKKGSNKEI